MKRLFSDIDVSLPNDTWVHFPDKLSALRKIIDVEDKIDSLVSRNLRTKLATTSQQTFHKKILRVFIRHQFIPTSGEDKSHYKIFIDGHILDSEYGSSIPVGNFFEKIKVATEPNSKRSMVQEKQLEWNMTQFAEGHKATGFQFKLYGDKAINTRILFVRSSTPTSTPRFELSSKLRALLPDIHSDPTEEEVVMAVWQYLLSKGLFAEGREKKVFRCDELLKEVTGVDSLLLSTLRAKLSEHLLPCKPIQVEYSLSPTSTRTGDRFNASGLSKDGGKSFDIEVEVLDKFCADRLQLLNDIGDGVLAANSRTTQHQTKALFIARSIACQVPQLRSLGLLADEGSTRQSASHEELRRHSTYSSSFNMLASTDVGEIINRSCEYQKLILTRVGRSGGDLAAVGNGAAPTAARKTSSAPPRVSIPSTPDSISAIHMARGYLDVGDDALFAAHASSVDIHSRHVRSTWTRNASKAIIQTRARVEGASNRAPGSLS